MHWHPYEMPMEPAMGGLQVQEVSSRDMRGWQWASAATLATFLFETHEDRLATSDSTDQ